MKSDAETRVIALPSGGALEINVMPGFYDKVRKHFGMSPGERIDDDRLRMFVFGAFKGAIDKAEKA